MPFVQGLQPLESFLTIVHTHREVHIQQHDIHRLCRHCGKKLFRLGKFDDMLKRALQRIAQCGQDIGVVVTDDNGAVVHTF